jgi:hypothetical protein
VEGTNDAKLGVGVAGKSNGLDGTGVRGVGYMFGVRGVGLTGAVPPTGLWGSTGVKGEGDTGVWGQTRRPGWSGVYGEAKIRDAYGVVGDGASRSYAGVLGRNPEGYGGRFEGGQAQLMLTPGSTAGRPTGAHTKGELYMDSDATLWVCTASGNPATWRRVQVTFS